MNSQLSPRAIDACLEVLYRGLVQIRIASQDGDNERAEAIADALHNLPHLLLEGDRRGWTVAAFRALFLAELIERHPELSGLDELLQAVE
jgi:hypothetical protein